MLIGWRNEQGVGIGDGVGVISGGGVLTIGGCVACGLSELHSAAIMFEGMVGTAVGSGISGVARGCVWEGCGE